jgi:hypothetical protein
LKKSAHIRITGYLRSREIEKNGTGGGKKSGAKAKVRAWEVRAVRIAKLDRAVQEDPATDIPGKPRRVGQPVPAKSGALPLL